MAQGVAIADAAICAAVGYWFGITLEAKMTAHLGVLPPVWFGIVLRRAVQHAIRYSDYFTVVAVRVTREYAAFSVDAGAETLTGVADIIVPMIRESDIVGELEDGRLSLVLSDADAAAARAVIERVGEALTHVKFSVSMEFAIGSASCPIDAVDASALIAHAGVHAALHIRSPLSAPMAPQISY